MTNCWQIENKSKTNHRKWWTKFRLTRELKFLYSIVFLFLPRFTDYWRLLPSIYCRIYFSTYFCTYFCLQLITTFSAVRSMRCAPKRTSEGCWGSDVGFTGLFERFRAFLEHFLNFVLLTNAAFRIIIFSIILPRALCAGVFVWSLLFSTKAKSRQESRAAKGNAVEEAPRKRKRKPLERWIGWAQNENGLLSDTDGDTNGEYYLEKMTKNEASAEIERGHIGGFRIEQMGQSKGGVVLVILSGSPWKYEDVDNYEYLYWKGYGLLYWWNQKKTASTMVWCLW